jgi:hypothetical protein
MRPVLTVAAAVLAMLLGACAHDPRDRAAKDDDRSPWTEQQKKALDDPMNYRPDMGRTDVSGGGISDFDRKGFKDDIKAWTLD